MIENVPLSGVEHFDPDERIGIPSGALTGGVSEEARALAFAEDAHRAMSSFEAVQAPMLAVLRHALVFSTTWRRCYLGCVCQRCQLDAAVKTLVRTVLDQRR